MFRYLTALALVTLTALVLTHSSPPAYAADDWEQVGEDILGTASSTDTGRSVSMSADGSIVAVGSWESATTGPGSVRVFELISGAWVQKGSDLEGSANGDYFGNDIDMSADGLTVVIGAPYNTSRAGEVFVYQWSGTAWAQKGATLTGAAGNTDFGFAVALSDDGDTLAVGAPAESTSVGKVYLYSWNSGTSSWDALGSAISGDPLVTGENSGRALAMSANGRVVVIGARNAVDGSAFPGVARVYAWSGSAWAQRGVDIPGEATNDRFGQSVAMSGNGEIIAVGAYENDGAGLSAGHVQVFGWDGTSWNQRGADIDGLAAGDEFGYSLALSSDGLTVIAGGPDDSSSPAATGFLRAFTYNSSTWSQKGSTLSGRNSGELFGNSVAVSADASFVIAGAPNDDTVATNSGLARVFRFVVESEVSPAGTPGIYLHVAGPVGRLAEGSPVYYGSDRVAITSTYLLTITNQASGATSRVLAEGVVDARGNLEARALLPALEPGDYDVVFQGKHRGGAGLRLSARITVGDAGQITTLGPNIPQLW